MKVINILELYQNGLIKLDNLGIGIHNIRYISLFHEYEAQMAQGIKKVYVIEKLAKRYGISFRKAYRIIKQLNKEL